MVHDVEFVERGKLNEDQWQTFKCDPVIEEQL